MPDKLAQALAAELAMHQPVSVEQFELDCSCGAYIGQMAITGSNRIDALLDLRTRQIHIGERLAAVAIEYINKEADDA